MVSAAIAAVLALPASTNTAAATPWCGADSLSLSTTPPMCPTEDNSRYLYFSVLLTNTSAQTCTLQGYPGVDGTTNPHYGVPPDPSDPPFSGIVSAARTGGDEQPVVLAPGATASSDWAFSRRQATPSPGPPPLSS
ncbi:hypothetical protein MSAR_29730 [Mycolicibacterium sarraceniae]|uniref:DUF4232 domain-containing protein n=1 Tax=Mycolicibacterium sarraceniae TaxID=1534348 RepID=A0A7I7SS52_9MYCO|nr:hypothetical protein MSAR_29730 [Mycolicibacterium sarraceniae]